MEQVGNRVEVKQSEGKGRGIYARKEFKKGERILEITGDIIETDDPDSFPETITEHWGPLGNDGKTYRFIMPEPPWMYMNHSCDANAGILNDRTLVATRDIKTGEEITTDYSAIDIETLTRGKKRLSMGCRCGSPKCRRIITTYDQLGTEDQERLRPYLNEHLRAKYGQRNPESGSRRGASSASANPSGRGARSGATRSARR